MGSALEELQCKTNIGSPHCNSWEGIKNARNPEPEGFKTRFPLLNLRVSLNVFGPHSWNNHVLGILALNSEMIPSNPLSYFHIRKIEARRVKWLVSVNPTLKQEDCYELQASLGSRVSCRPFLLMMWESISKQNKQNTL